MSAAAPQSPLVEMAPEHTVEPVTAPAERHRDEYRAALCEVAEFSGALWMAVAIGPQNTTCLDCLEEGFRHAVVRSLLAYSNFMAARDCAGSA